MSNFSNQIQSVLLEAANFLESRGVDSPRLEAEVLLAHLLKIERLELYKVPERVLQLAGIKQYQEILALRADGMPTAYIRGKKDFFSLTFRVGSGVLIPRADTECVVEACLPLLHSLRNPSVLDLGVGSGAILITLMKEVPHARGVGIDKSSLAMEYAKYNASFHGVESVIEFLQGDLFVPLPRNRKFDLIVSNPPYIPTDKISSELRFEPREAFDGGDDGFWIYKKILKEAPCFLKKTGYLVLEIDDNSLKQILNGLEQEDFSYQLMEVKKDLASKNRAIILCNAN